MFKRFLSKSWLYVYARWLNRAQRINHIVPNVQNVQYAFQLTKFVSFAFRKYDIQGKTTLKVLYTRQHLA